MSGVMKREAQRQELLRRMKKPTGEMNAPDEPVVTALYFVFGHLDDDHDRAAVKDLLELVKMSEARSPLPIVSWRDLALEIAGVVRLLMADTPEGTWTFGRARAVSALSEVMLLCRAEWDALLPAQHLPKPASGPTIGSML